MHIQTCSNPGTVYVEYIIVQYIKPVPASIETPGYMYMKIQFVPSPSIFPNLMIQ